MTEVQYADKQMEIITPFKIANIDSVHHFGCIGFR